MGGTVQVSDLLQLARDMGLDPEFEGWVNRGVTELDLDPAGAAPAPESPAPAPATPARKTLVAPPPAPAPVPTDSRPVAHVRTQVPRARVEPVPKTRSKTARLLAALVPVAIGVGLLAGQTLLHPAGAHAAASWRKSAVAARQQVAVMTVRLDAARAAAKQQQTAGADAAQRAQQVAHDLADCTTKTKAVVDLLAHVDPHDLTSAQGFAADAMQSCGHAHAEATP